MRVAIGRTVDDEYVEFNTRLNWVVADFKNLATLELPSFLGRLDCVGNHLTRLDLPDGMNILYCDKDLFDYDKCIVSNANIIYDKEDYKSGL